MVEELLKWLIGFVCGGAVSLAGAFLTHCRARRARNRSIEKGLQALLRAEIIRSYETYQDKDFCPLYARETLRREYEAYHALGGNDVATDLYHKTMALPTDPAEEVGA